MSSSRNENKKTRRGRLAAGKSNIQPDDILFLPKESLTIPVIKSTGMAKKFTSRIIKLDSNPDLSKKTISLDYSHDKTLVDKLFTCISQVSVKRKMML
jgi:hypothetical protein